MKKKEEKKKSGSKLLIITILIIIISFGTILYLGNYIKEKKTEETTYNNFLFYYSKAEKLWYTQIQMGKQLYNIPFYYHPTELEDIIVEEGVEDKIWRKPQQLFITFPPDMTPTMGIAGSEISRLTGDRYSLFSIPTKSSLTEKTNISIGVTCEFANENTVVIYFHLGDRNIVFSKDNCIIIYATNDNESLRVADAFAYHLLKIM